jgi:hypothetical protein
LPFDTNGDTIFSPHCHNPSEAWSATEAGKIKHVAYACSFTHFGGAIVISFPFLFVFAPFIVLSLMILFAGKPKN